MESPDQFIISVNSCRSIAMGTILLTIKAHLFVSFCLLSEVWPHLVDEKLSTSYRVIHKWTHYLYAALVT